MTGYGFCGPQTDYDTVFDAKAEAAGTGGNLLLLGVGSWLFWITHEAMCRSQA